MKRTGYRRMVRWFSPRQLVRTLAELVTARVVTRIIDPRTLEGAGQESTPLCMWKDWDEVWFDFVADTGDGWNPTFSVARALAQERLVLRDPALRDHVTRRGDLLVLGGDLAYPSPRDDNYETRLVAPYREALPKASGGELTVLAIPGNHDWFDGLRAFTRRFGKPGNPFAAWVTCQTRSYFAAALPGDWWLLGVDVQLGGRLDVPQLRYFHEVASCMNERSRVILAMPEPDWLELPGRRNDTAETPTEQIERILDREVDLSLAGNLHHYRRHETIPCEKHRAVRQRITAGGGGAFLHPTHVPLARTLRNRLELRASFPPPRDSLAYRKRLLAFPLLNPSFGLMPALLYGLLALSALPTQDWHSFGEFLGLVSASIQSYPPSWGVVGLFAVAIFWFRERGSLASWFLASGHLIVQVSAALVAAAWSSGLTETWLGDAAANSRHFATVGLTAAAGFVVGSVIMGGYLWVSSLFGTLLDESYSSLRVQDWKSFLRIRVSADGGLTLFPVGLRKVARNWRRVAGDGEEPTLQPEDEVTPPALIEVPLELGRR